MIIIIISTTDMLYHIELRMEDLTREQETLNFEKVMIIIIIIIIIIIAVSYLIT